MSSALENRAQIAGWIAEEGIVITIRREVPGTYNPATGSAGAAGTPVTFSGHGRIGDYNDRLVDGTLVKVGDRRMTFQPDDWSYEPKQGDVLTVPAGYAIVGRIQKRELGGVPFSYTAQLRGQAA
jgi:hypothetical protein